MFDPRAVEKIVLIASFLGVLVASGLGVVQIDTYALSDALTSFDMPFFGTVDISLADVLTLAGIGYGLGTSGVLMGAWRQMREIDLVITITGVVGFVGHIISPTLQNFVSSSVAIQAITVLVVTLSVVSLLRDNFNQGIYQYLIGD